MANNIIEKFKEELGDHHPYTLRAPFSPLLCARQWVLPGTIEFSLILINKGRDSLFIFDEEKYFGYARDLFKKYLKKEVNLSDIRKKYDEIDSVIIKYYFEVMHANLGNFTDKEITALAVKGKDLMSILVDLTIFIETFNIDIAIEIIGKDGANLVHKLWDRASHPAFLSFDARRMDYILSKLQNITEEKELKQLSLDFKYIYTDYFSSKSDTEILATVQSIVAQKIEKESDVKKAKENWVMNRKDFDDWRDTLNEEEKHFIDYIQFTMELRDIRKDPIAMVQAIDQRIAEELCVRSGIPKDLVYVLLSGELPKGLPYILEHKEEIINRKNGVIVINKDNGDYEIESGNFEELIKEANDILTNSVQDNQGILKGQIASKGKINGTVRIILDSENYKDFNDGDILVTSMTRPEFLPLMKKAGAVITNEGGVTCHAAIVSRELKIPCIIGTKIATLFLKDGDKVEVDANTGTIKVIK